MSNFFDSDIIQDELREINKLQEQIYGSILTFGMMSREDKLDSLDYSDSITEILSTVNVLLEGLYRLGHTIK